MFDPDPDDLEELEVNSDYNTTPKHNLGDGGYRTLPTPQDE